jgi:hypothetical protein
LAADEHDGDCLSEESGRLPIDLESRTSSNGCSARRRGDGVKAGDLCESSARKGEDGSGCEEHSEFSVASWTIMCNSNWPADDRATAASAVEAAKRCAVANEGLKERLNYGLLV